MVTRSDLIDLLNTVRADRCYSAVRGHVQLAGQLSVKDALREVVFQHIGSVLKTVFINTREKYSEPAAYEKLIGYLTHLVALDTVEYSALDILELCRKPDFNNKHMRAIGAHEDLEIMFGNSLPSHSDIVGGALWYLLNRSSIEEDQLFDKVDPNSLLHFYFEEHVARKIKKEEAERVRAAGQRTQEIEDFQKELQRQEVRDEKLSERARRKRERDAALGITEDLLGRRGDNQ